MHNVSIRCACALLVGGCAGLAIAASPPTAAVVPAATAHAQPFLNGLGPTVGVATLANMSGGSSVTTRVTLNGGVTNSSTQNVVTGLNSIGGDAFGSAVGLPVVIQNSGNSVVIQNATTVNLQLQP